MAAGDPIPTNIPPMGAAFNKPYMEFEYQGQMWRLENLKGGHNGAVAQGGAPGAAAACQAMPPVFDTTRGVWVVPVQNNIIDIDLNAQPDMVANRPLGPRLSQMTIRSEDRTTRRTTGLLITQTADPNDVPRFPVVSEFYAHIRVRVPGFPHLVNVTPFTLRSNELVDWPPPIGTRYQNQDSVSLVPEFGILGAFTPFVAVRIRPGDEAVLTDVFVAN